MRKKTALITGAGLRIGAGIATDLAKENYNLILHYNQSKKAINSLKENLESHYNTKITLWSANFDSYPFSGATMNIFNQQIDLLINSASSFPKRSFLDETPETFQQTININFTSPFFVCQHFLKSQTSGHIINILDTTITTNNDTHCCYSIAKKSLAHLTLLIAKSAAPSIRCNGISPGYILDPVNTNLSPAEQEAKKARNPLHQKGSIESITNAVSYLEKQSFVTGQILFVDGGQHIS